MRAQIAVLRTALTPAPANRQHNEAVIRIQDTFSKCFAQAQEISDHVATSRRHVHFGHPLFDRVRACSSEPDDAAAFFARLLWPWAETRASAGSMLKSTYMESTLHEMLQDRRHASMQAGKDC